MQAKNSMKRSRVCIGMLCWMMVSTTSSFTLSSRSSAQRTPSALYSTTGFGGGRGDESSSYSLDSTSRGAMSTSTVTVDEFVPDDRGVARRGTLAIPPVLAAAMLITGNTVGAGILVLPELAAGPGLATSTAVFGAAWIMNVLSALVVMDLVLVDRTDDATAETTSPSFQDLAATHLDSQLAGTVVSSLSVLCNACVLAFDMRQSGLVGESLLQQPAIAPILATTVAASLVALLTTRSPTQLAGIGSVCVTLVLLSLGSVLGPGLLAVPDLAGTFTAPGVLPSSLGHTAPIIVMSMVFQNIVPTVVRMLDYQRDACTRAIVAGSCVPLVLYVTWCLACSGGGIDVAGMTGGGSSQSVLLAVFALATLGGSSVCSSLSLAAECMAAKETNNKNEETTTAANLPAALAAVGVPLTAALFWHDSSGAGLTDALALAGSIGSPILYGVLPAIMAWKSQSSTLPPLALPVLGLASSAFVGHEVLSRVL